jgi:hypothetical protein
MENQIMTQKYSSAPLGGSILGATTQAESPFPQNSESGNDSFLRKVGANSKVALTTAGAFAALFAANSAASTVDFTQSSYNVDESAGVATIGVKLNCQPGENPDPVSVSYSSSNGTATAGSSGDSTADYTAVSGTLTWGNSGSLGTNGGDCGATRNFYVPIFNNDAIVENNETVNLSLNNGNTAVLTILENGVYDFSSSSYSVDEDAGVATIEVIKHCSLGTTCSPPVSYNSSNGTATAGSSGSLGGDYTAVNGSLTWGASGCECDTTRTFDVPIRDDSEVEGNETVNLSLSNGNTAVLTILDNEPPLAVRLDDLAATPDNGSIIVEWTTGVEIDSAGFHIWRANMGQFGGYTNITQITAGNMIYAQGNSHSSFDYSYVDHDVVYNTIYYYALEEVDYDAQSTYHFDYIVSGTAK